MILLADKKQVCVEAERKNILIQSRVTPGNPLSCSVASSSGWEGEGEGKSQGERGLNVSTCMHSD